MNSLNIIPLILTITITSAIKFDGVTEIYKNKNNINVAMLVRNTTNKMVEEALTKSAKWTIQRMNELEIVPFLDFGLYIYRTNNEIEDIQVIFDHFQKRNEEFTIGFVTNSKLSLKICKFCEALDLDIKQIGKYSKFLIKATVNTLSALNWTDNITIVAPNNYIVEEFSKVSQKAWICVSEYLIYMSVVPARNVSSGNWVIFGNHDALSAFAQVSNGSGVLFVPLDGTQLNDLPDGSLAVVPPFVQSDQLESLHSPFFFDIAVPLVGYAQNLWYFLMENCNETIYKLNCVRNRYFGVPESLLEPSQVLDLLKMEPNFVYQIIKSDNTSMFTYNIFTENLIMLEGGLESNSSTTSCSDCKIRCKNFDPPSQLNIFSKENGIRIRTESWVFAFLSISLLGVLFCFAILIFLLIAICRQNVLEGNPMMTLLLLVVVMLMYCSILPFSLEGTKSQKELICMSRSLTITLSFASAFSLILSRSILLATAGKEIGFMSHVAGQVQSFLCLFIFGVQAALSLQIIGRSCEIFHNHSFMYLLAYNAMLLLLLLCLTPLIFKCHRNYREGKYFTIATVIIICLWLVWVPSFIFFEEEWKDSILCFGLVSTASVLIGTIFVPRTYLMTIAAARDKITNSLPTSLAAASSAMDIYRAGTQPVYDCINVAAINAVTVARAGVNVIQQSNLYSCPNLPADDDEIDFRCDSPISNDKVTRF